MSWVPVSNLAAQLGESLSESELAHYQRLALAINHAFEVATELPTSLDARARELIITKLQEAGHWSVELLRAAECSRRLL